MKKFVCFKRFKNKAIDGEVNIPRGKDLESDGEFLYYQGKRVCTERSSNACEYFALNTDGKGLERGDYTASIQRALSNQDEKHQARWDRLWGDAVSQQYRRKDYPNYWLWDTPFFQATIEDLQHIMDLVKGA